MRNPIARRFAAGLLFTALLGAACGNADTDPSSSGDGDGQSISGSIAIDGSSTVFPIAQAVAEEFQIANPDAQISVGLAGTGGGFEAFCAGDIEISNASRAIEEDEAECLDKAGIAYTEFQIGVDGLAVVTHPETDWVDCMTFEQLKAVYEPGSKITDWSQADPSWPDEELNIFGPDPDSGTYDYFAETVADPESDEPATRDDMTQSADDNVLVRGVQGETASIGYFGFAYFEENSQGLKALEIDSGDSGCVAPSAETVLSNEYPLSRPLFFYVANDAMDSEVVAEFVRFWVENAAEYATAVGYVEPPDDVSTQNEQTLEGLSS